MIEATYKLMQQVVKKKWTVLVCFVFVFFVSFSGLWAIGLVPSSMLGAYAERFTVPLPISTTPNDSYKPMFEKGQGEAPLKIEIPAVGVAANVKNPDTTDVQLLDQALLSGAVRYPTSARLGEEGNVVIFGHSSQLPIVQNQAFKAFNNIEDLKEGDQILVTSDERRYIYAVETVKKADAEEDWIPLNVEGSRLTLSTCDTFTSKSARFVVTANLVSVDTLDEGV